MKIFISWSGTRSRVVAAALRDWLPVVLHYADPWVSDRDIHAGGRWAVEIGKVLKNANFGIIVLTADNLNAPWVLFEAGALSKAFASGAVVPYLVDVDFKELSGPLAQFQAKKADRQSTFELLEAINNRVSAGISETRLRELFDALWPRLAEKLQNLPADAKPVTARDHGEILEQLVQSSRRMEERLDHLESGFIAATYSRTSYNVKVTVDGSFRDTTPGHVFNFMPLTDVIAEVAVFMDLAVEEYGDKWHLADRKTNYILNRNDGQTYAKRSRRRAQWLVLRDTAF